MSKQKIAACKAAEVEPGKQKIVLLNGRSIGIFNLDGEYHALLNVCPHRGAALCEGPVCGTALPTDEREFVYGREDEIVRCAWHGWEFDIKTGEYLADPSIKALKFDVAVEDGDVYVLM